MAAAQVQWVAAILRPTNTMTCLVARFVWWSSFGHQPTAGCGGCEGVLLCNRNPGT